MRSKKALKIVLAIAVVCVLAAGVNGLMYIQKINHDIELPEFAYDEGASESNCVSGNCIIRTRDNGIKEFPFLLDMQLEVVSVPDMKAYPVMRSAEFGEYSAGEWCMIAGHMAYWHNKLIDITDKGTSYEEAKYPDGMPYAIYKTKLYHIDTGKDYCSREEGGRLYCFDMKSKKESLINEDHVDFVTIKGKTLYYYNKSKCRLYVQDCNKPKDFKKYDLDLKKGTGIFAVASEGDIIFIQTGYKGKNSDIYKFNRKTRNLRSIGYETGFADDTDSQDYNNLTIKNGKLYFSDAKMNVYRYYSKNYKTEKSNKGQRTEGLDLIIDGTKVVNQHKEDTDPTDATNPFKVYWCRDYIVYDCAWCEGKADLKCFDYEGNTVK